MKSNSYSQYLPNRILLLHDHFTVRIIIFIVVVTTLTDELFMSLTNSFENVCHCSDINWAEEQRVPMRLRLDPVQST